MKSSASFQTSLRRLQLIALAGGVIGLLLSIFGYLTHPLQFFRSYLLAYLFWLGITLGCMAILMLHHLVGGGWGALIRRILEAASRLVPLMLVLFIPLLSGLRDLYAWAAPDYGETQALTWFREMYLQVAFFVARTGLYFLTWLLVIFFLNSWARQQERLQDAAAIRVRRRRLQKLSGIGLVLYGLTMSFAAIDWMMSLESHWFSTIYGFMVITGQGLSALAFAIVVIAWLARFEPVASVISADLLHDLGNLLLAFVILWAYMAFSQLLITWAGDLPEEIQWYIRRTGAGWEIIRVLLLLFHFTVPFLLLLSRAMKRHGQFLPILAAVLLGMHLIDLFWLLMPAFFPQQFHLHWLDIVIPVGMGGFWLAGFLWQLRRRTLLPLHDPHLQEVMQHD